VSRPEIGSELHEMDLVEPVNRFEFQDDLPCDHQVDAGSPDGYAFEGNVDRKLRFKGNGPMSQRNPHRAVIHRFEKAGSQLFMHGKSSPDHFTGKFLESKHP